jgi:hypothetical protein
MRQAVAGRAREAAPYRGKCGARVLRVDEGTVSPHHRRAELN